MEKVDNVEENKTIDEVSKKWNMNEKILETFVCNIAEDQKLKQRYATILISVLIFQLIALITIFVLQGIGLLSYSDVSFNIFVTGGIAEVYVLVRVIVKYLFNDNLTDLLKIILRANNIYGNKNKKDFKSNIKNSNK